MLKVMIVDDEAIVRIGLKSCINWEEYGFEIIGDASNGKEALRLFDKIQPDILLTDIKMPVMDGIELIKLLSQKYPCTKVLVLSCFNEYNLVREAMKYGAMDYLFKPTMKSEDILAAVNEVKERLMRERAERNEVTNLKYSVNESLSFLKEKYLNQLVKRNFERSSIYTEMRRLGIELDERNIICFAIEIDEHEKIKERYSYDELQIFYTTCLSIVNEAILHIDHGICFMDEVQHIILFINAESSSEKSLHEQLLFISNKIQNMVKIYADISLSIGVSHIVSDYSGMKYAYQQAKKALSGKFYSGRGRAYFYEEFKTDLPGMKDSLSTEIRELEQAMNIRDLSMVLKKIEDIFVKTGTRRDWCKEDVCRLAIDLAIICLRIYRDEIKLEDFFSDDPNMLHEVFKNETIDEVESWLKNIIAGLITSLKKYSPAVLKALDFISGNFTRDITLQEISEYVYMSKNYFSKVFKDETGENFVEYLSRVRINHAKKLLESENLKAYEVSERVGYTNYRYFCRIFKKITGINPSDVKCRRTLINAG